MTCPRCGFRGNIEWSIPVCPICGFVISKPRSKMFLMLLRFSDWLLDRRFAIVTKRQRVDTKPTKFNYYRIWWIYYLFDILPILRSQDPTSLFIQTPYNISTGDNKKWN